MLASASSIGSGSATLQKAIGSQYQVPDSCIHRLFGRSTDETAAQVFAKGFLDQLTSKAWLLDNPPELVREIVERSVISGA